MKDIKAAALSLYKPPFQFHHGYIYDGEGRMFADDGGVDELRNMMTVRMRGWGRIQYMEEFDPCKLQDEVGKLCAQALTEFWERNTK